MAVVIAVGKSVWMCNGFVRILRHLLTVNRAVYGALGGYNYLQNAAVLCHDTGESYEF